MIIYVHVYASGWETVGAVLLFLGVGWGDNVQWHLHIMVVLPCNIFWGGVITVQWHLHFMVMLRFDIFWGGVG